MSVSLSDTSSRSMVYGNKCKHSGNNIYILFILHCFGVVVVHHVSFERNTEFKTEV